MDEFSGTEEDEEDIVSLSDTQNRGRSQTDSHDEIGANSVIPRVRLIGTFSFKDSMREGQFFAKRFQPPTAEARPQDLYMIAYASSTTTPRYIRRTDIQEMLVFTDGSCLNNGRDNAKGGWAFSLHPAYDMCRRDGSMERVKPLVFSGTLEDVGPTGIAYRHTSNRAELRAVISALSFRAWFGEGFQRLVIATDSEYVVRGVLEWSPVWKRRNWCTAKGTPVENRDLWEHLLQKLDSRGKQGLDVLFWRIPRALNYEADEAAKDGATLPAVRDFGDVFGVGL